MPYAFIYLIVFPTIFVVTENNLDFISFQNPYQNLID